MGAVGLFEGPSQAYVCLKGSVEGARKAWKYSEYTYVAHNGSETNRQPPNNSSIPTDSLCDYRPLYTNSCRPKFTLIPVPLFPTFTTGNNLPVMPVNAVPISPD